MVKKYAGRYSKYLRPISIIFDLLVVSSFVYLFLDKSLFKVTPILIFCALWIISALITKFYEVYRFTKLIRIISYIFYQLLLFSILVFAFFGVAQNPAPGLSQTLIFLLYTFIIISNELALLLGKLLANIDSNTSRRDSWRNSSELHKCDECDYSTQRKLKLILHAFSHDKRRAITQFKCSYYKFTYFGSRHNLYDHYMNRLRVEWQTDKRLCH